MSYLAGIIQPVLPMIEYYLFKESIITLFCVNQDVPESDCEATCYLTEQIEKSNQKTGSNGTLINVDDIPVFVVSGSFLLPLPYPPFENIKMRVVAHMSDGMLDATFHPPRT